MIVKCTGVLLRCTQAGFANHYVRLSNDMHAAFLMSRFISEIVANRPCSSRRSFVAMLLVSVKM